VLGPPQVSIKNSPTGQRMLTKPYLKDNDPRSMAAPADLVDQLTDCITTRHLGPDDLLFTTRDGTPSPGAPSAPGAGGPQSRLLESTSTSASTTSATPRHHHPEVPTFAPRRRRQEPRRPGPHPENPIQVVTGKAAD
jgi:hypothetical protein